MDQYKIGNAEYDADWNRCYLEIRVLKNLSDKLKCYFK